MHPSYSNETMSNKEYYDKEHDIANDSYYHHDDLAMTANHETNNSSSIHVDNDNQEEEEIRKFLWLVPLKAHVHPVQFFFFLFSVFASLAVIVYFSAAQSWTLTSLLFVGDSAGDITGSLSFYSEFISMIAVLCWGVASDYLEKRTINSISLVIMGIIVIAYPYASDVYPTLLILRFIYSVGTAGTTCMMAGEFTCFILLNDFHNYVITMFR